MASHRDLDPDELSLRDRHQTLIGGVGPRPIAFVGSVSKAGTANLAPFSFSNAFSSNPPHVGFSPSYRGSDASTKDSLRNVLETGEFTVSAVSHAMVQQMNLASGEYPPEVDEFAVAGFTKLASRKVAPPGVAESPFVMECRLHQHIELGTDRASGNLILGRVVLFRVREEAMDEAGIPDPRRMDLVGRLGRTWYTRARDGLFELPGHRARIALGFEALPEHLLTSSVLTGNDLARLAALPEKPHSAPLSPESIERYGKLARNELHRQIKAFISEGQLADAWALAELGS